MKKLVVIAVLVAGAAGIAYYTGLFTDTPAEGTAQGDGQGGGQARGGGQGGGFQGGGFQGGGRGGNRGGGRQGPMTVEVGQVTRATIQQELTVVGNLIGETTVSVAPRAAGRLQSVDVRLGDKVSRGQRIAKIEDFELVEQIKQQEAAQEVSQATIRQRETDLALARSEEHTSELQSQSNLVCRLLLEKKNK